MSAIGLPAHILRMFQPGPPLEYVPGTAWRRRPLREKLTGLAEWAEVLDREGQGEVSRSASGEKTSDREKKIAEYEQRKYEDHQRTADPKRTVFVGKIPGDVTERQLKRVVEKLCGAGAVRSVRIVYDLKGRSRKYGFIEVEAERFAKELHQRGLIVDGHRVVVDIERGRVDQNFLPKRLRSK
jgi:U1 small nuclear ribonucleoprotein